MSKLEQFWQEQWGGIVVGVALTLFTAVLGFLTWLLKSWWLHRGGLHFAIGQFNHPLEFVIRGKWDSDGRTAVLDPPRFMNASIPLTIRNRSRVPVNLSLDNVWFCSKEPEPYRVEVVNGEKRKTRSMNTPISTLGFDMIGDGDAKIGAVNIPARGSVRVRIIASATNPSIQTAPFFEWKIAWLQFVDADEKERPLSIPVSMNSRQLKLDVEPYYPMPDHYVGYQGGQPSVK